MLSSTAHGNPAPGLTRQPSMYTLTLEEIQHALKEPGKNIDSMNMEEFLKNIWTAEESQAIAAALTSVENNSLSRQASLQRVSSLTLPPDLSKKTVEDVWKEIQQHQVVDSADKKHHVRLHQQPARQATMGEMTLEDFLVKAGVSRDDPETSSHVTDGNSPVSLIAPVSVNASSSVEALKPDWINYSSQHHQHMLQQTEIAAAASVKRDLSSSLGILMLPLGNPMYDRMTDATGLSSDNLANSLALSPASSDFSMNSRKRFAPDTVYQKSMERRQKRMIKNRESAARSRARKQAYTVELEAEVSQLKEENARLKQQQALESHLQEKWPLEKPRVVLRRTQSF